MDKLQDRTGMQALTEGAREHLRNARQMTTSLRETYRNMSNEQIDMALDSIDRRMVLAMQDIERGKL